ncbi:transcriptional repressor [bacterium]|nr:transcriptional repressor [bacterium]
MKILPQELLDRIGCFEKGLQRAGVKITHQRQEIFRELAQSPDHPDAEMVCRSVRKRVPTISLDTVYRTLWLLMDLGLISTLGASRASTRFDANTKPHHHFVCSRCSSTLDFSCPEFDHLDIPHGVKALGYPEKTRVEVLGVCLQCKKTRPKAHNSERRE